MLDRQTSGVEASAAGRLACLNLIHAYNNLADSGQHIMIADLFTETAVLNANGDEMVGIEAIREGMRKRAAANRTTFHSSSNVQFLEDAAGALKALSALAVTILGDQQTSLSPSFLTRVNDEFVRLDSGEWRIQRRTLQIYARAT